MENKNEENKNKIILGDLNCTIDKMGRLVEIKQKDFTDAFPIMPSM